MITSLLTGSTNASKSSCNTASLQKTISCREGNQEATLHLYVCVVFLFLLQSCNNIKAQWYSCITPENRNRNYIHLWTKWDNGTSMNFSVRLCLFDSFFKFIYFQFVSLLVKSLSCIVSYRVEQLPADVNIKNVNEDFSNCTFIFFSGIILVNCGYWQELGEFMTRRAHSSICV